MSAWAKKVSVGSTAVPAKAPAKSASIGTTATAGTASTASGVPAKTSAKKAVAAVSDFKEGDPVAWRDDPWAALEDGLRIAFAKWDALQLAVRLTGDKEMGEWMCDAVLDMFKDSSPKNPVLADEIIDFLVDNMDKRFNMDVDPDDQFVDWLARLSITLYGDCISKRSYAGLRELIASAAEAKSAAIKVSGGDDESADDDDDGEGDGEEGDDEDEQDDAVVEEKKAPAAAASKKPAAVVAAAAAEVKTAAPAPVAVVAATKKKKGGIPMIVVGETSAAASDATTATTTTATPATTDATNTTSTTSTTTAPAAADSDDWETVPKKGGRKGRK